MTTKILLTGATGFVGRQVLIALQAKDVDLTLIIRPGSEQKIHNDILRSKVIFSEDLFAESVKWWEKTCQNIDIVVHLAWFLKPGEYLYSDKNIGAEIQLTRKLRDDELLFGECQSLIVVTI